MIGPARMKGVTTLSAAAKAALEAARHPNGQFGEQPHADPGAAVLAERTMTQQDAAGWLMADNYMLTQQEVAAGFAAAGIPEGQPVTYRQVERVKAWLQCGALIDIETRNLEREVDAMWSARRRAGTVAVKCAVLRIRQLHPDQLDSIMLRRGDNDRAHWEAFDDDGHELPMPDDFHAALAEYDPVIDFTDTQFIHGLATGRRWDGRPPTGATFDQGGRTIAIDVNWRQM